MAENMFKEGFRHITAVDYSPIAIQKQRLRAEKLVVNGGKLTYLEMDVTKMNFGNEEFDIVIDKGTIDAILCAEKASELVRL